MIAALKWHWHRYGKWEDMPRVVNALTQPTLIQQKRCSVCNKAKLRSTY